ncbi:unnamed protein product [Rangifer tarandus platyrhynchus]|uniref:Uncharacterized protein n=2 Tax=Rangifer tarandus platyrhynchus TaxID=3082113 RepID=A0ABN9A156_RANTA|nr:unnamed protein product [Rangifer tarandus platyrhynchus]CAI9714147.1 unnamed protein product [Rangifer tarandus platyrhynchus]
MTSQVSVNAGCWAERSGAAAGGAPGDRRCRDCQTPQGRACCCCRSQEGQMDKPSSFWVEDERESNRGVKRHNLCKTAS